LGEQSHLENCRLSFDFPNHENLGKLESDIADFNAIKQQAPQSPH